MKTDDFQAQDPKPAFLPTLEEDPGAQLQADFSSESSLLYDAWTILLRRRYWAIGALVASVLIALGLVFIMHPKYDAVSAIRIQENSSGDVQLGDAPAAQLLGGETMEAKVQTEITVLSSPTLAIRVADALNLYTNTTLSVSSKKEGTPSAHNPVSVHRVIAALQRAETIKMIPHTDAISITVRTHSPELSAQIANTLVDQYIERGFQVRYQSQQVVSDWLAKQLDDLRKQTETAQSKTLELGKKLDLLNAMAMSQAPVSMGSSQGGMAAAMPPSPEPLEAQRLVGLQQTLVAAESDMLVKDAQYHVLLSSDYNAIQPVQDPVLTAILADRASTMAQYNAYASKYGPNNSEMKQLKNRIGELDKQIDGQLSGARARALGDLTAARASVKSLQAQIDGAKQKLHENDDDIVQYTIAERDFESSYALYQGLLQKLKEAGVLAGLHANDIEIIDRALVPLTPSVPEPLLFIAGGLAAGLVLGCLLALIVESMDKSILDGDKLEQATGCPTLGTIPKVKSADAILLRALANKEDMKASARQSTEAYWALRTALLLSNPGQHPRVIAITSSVPAEGKSTTSLNLAYILAQGEYKVLLMECDLRRPSFGPFLGMRSLAGLSQVLVGMKTMEECIQSIPGVDNLSVLLAGIQPPNPAELLGSHHFAQLLNQLRNTYDFVILDAPPTLSVSDSRIIAAQADGVLFVVKSGDTARHMVNRSCQMLRRSGARLLGGVLNAIDYRSATYGYYGYYDYYTTGRSESESKEKK